MMKKATGVEYPVRTICRAVETVDFPAGAYHLNLAAPLGVARCKKSSQLFLSPHPSKMDRRMLMQGLIPDSLKDYAA